MADKTPMQHHLDGVIDMAFAGLEKLPGIVGNSTRTAMLEKYKAVAKDNLDKIENLLPPSPTPNNIIDAIITVVEDAVPNTMAGFFERQGLELIRLALHALFAQAPVVGACP